MSDFGLIWRPFRKYLQIKNFFFKNSTLSFFYLYSPPTSYKKSEKFLEPSLRKLHYQPAKQPTKYESVWFWANLETFLQISPNQFFFFKNPALSLSYLYSPLTSCKKSQKSLEPFLRKLRYQPTNRPIITNNTDLVGPRWRWSKKKEKDTMFLSKILILFFMIILYILEENIFVVFF